MINFADNVPCFVLCNARSSCNFVHKPLLPGPVPQPEHPLPCCRGSVVGRDLTDVVAWNRAKSGFPKTEHFLKRFHVLYVLI